MQRPTNEIYFENQNCIFTQIPNDYSCYFGRKRAERKCIGDQDIHLYFFSGKK